MKHRAKHRTFQCGIEITGKPTRVPAIEPVPSDAATEPNVKGRYLFLLALRHSFPAFWQSLYAEVWKSPEPQRALWWWAGQRNVVDEWLLDVVRETLEYWTANPNSPAANLAEGYQWFFYRAPWQMEMKPFSPTFTNARPLLSGIEDILRVLREGLSPAPGQSPEFMAAGSLDIEPLEQFTARMRQQFEWQLGEYKKQFERRLLFGSQPEMQKHAIWTACRFMGAGYMDIAAKWPGLSQPYQPDKTVTMAVRRFADSIGLTLPKAR